jgi:hypothetical protein
MKHECCILREFAIPLPGENAQDTQGSSRAKPIFRNFFEVLYPMSDIPTSSFLGKI